MSFSKSLKQEQIYVKTQKLFWCLIRKKKKKIYVKTLSYERPPSTKLLGVNAQHFHEYICLSRF